MTNVEVAEAWAEGKAARSYTGNFRTDGTILYSYQLPIGWHDAATGYLIVGDYTAPGGRFYSMTTSRHVGTAWSMPQASLLPADQFEAILG